jgi:dihydrofolate reductase
MNMGKVIAEFAMSLDGFIADAQDGVWDLYKWLTDGDVALPLHDRVFMTSQVSADHYREIMATTGAQVTGRRDFDISKAWGGQSPMNVPIFIVTHSPPQEWLDKESPFTFITEGVERAVEQARQIAGEKNVAVNGSKITQQCLQAGLLDEIWIDLVPILLSKGIPLFADVGIGPVELAISQVMDAPGVTHLRYRVVK